MIIGIELSSVNLVLWYLRFRIHLLPTSLPCQQNCSRTLANSRC